MSAAPFTDASFGPMQGILACCGATGIAAAVDPDVVCDDLQDGYLAPATMEIDYDVAIVNGAVDRSRTEALRKSRTARS